LRGEAVELRAIDRAQIRDDIPHVVTHRLTRNWPHQTGLAATVRVDRTGHAFMTRDPR